jgi:hypothetical protein
MRKYEIMRAWFVLWIPRGFIEADGIVIVDLIVKLNRKQTF